MHFHDFRNFLGNSVCICLCISSTLQNYVQAYADAPIRGSLYRGRLGANSCKCLGTVLDARAAYHDPYPKCVRWYHQTTTIETSTVQALDGYQFNRSMVEHQTVTIGPFQNGI